MDKNSHSDTAMIVNQRGLHARAAAKLAKLASSFDCSIKVHHNSNTACGKDILDLLTLAASPGAEVTIETFNGDDANKALKAITALIKNGFEEDQKLCPIDKETP